MAPTSHIGTPFFFFGLSRFFLAEPARLVAPLSRYREDRQLCPHLPTLLPTPPPLLSLALSRHLSPPSTPSRGAISPLPANMSELLKSSAGGAAVGEPVAPCCDTGNGKTAGAELAGIKGAAAGAAPACDGAVGGETTREFPARPAVTHLAARLFVPGALKLACACRVLALDPRINPPPFQNFIIEPNLGFTVPNVIPGAPATACTLYKQQSTLCTLLGASLADPQLLAATLPRALSMYLLL